MIAEVGQEPEWSPDGTEIAFTRYHQRDINTADIWVVNSNGSNLRSVLLQGNDEGVYCTQRRTVSEKCDKVPVYTLPVWSSLGIAYLYLNIDSVFFYVCLLNGGCFDKPVSGHDYDITVDGRLVTIGDEYIRIVDNPFSSEFSFVDFTEFDYGGHHSLSVSPDGSRIAFTHKSGLSVVHIDRSNYSLIVESSTLFSPSWSPDGTQIAYIRIDFSSGNRAIHIVSLEDGTQRIVLEPSRISGLDWSPWLDTETATSPISWGTLKREQITD